MSVAVVIPAYNEEKTIASVLEAVQRTPEVAELIVVDDGSEDRTAQVAEGLGARVVRLGANRGKGAAMRVGAEVAREPVVVFLDADLVGLRPVHIRALAAPLLEGRAEMAVGVFAEGRMATDLAQRMVPHLSGQRAMRREDVLQVSGLERARYGAEVAFSRYARWARLRVELVPLPGLSQVMKEEKRGFCLGLAARLLMYWEILRRVVSKG
ncbi:MAG: glycosyltransferase family 2 protein [Bacillota bacterium]|nr:glycosyltransferase family 2 protein [Bacillota bacterium]